MGAGFQSKPRQLARHGVSSTCSLRVSSTDTTCHLAGAVASLSDEPPTLFVYPFVHTQIIRYNFSSIAMQPRSHTGPHANTAGTTPRRIAAPPSRNITGRVGAQGETRFSCAASVAWLLSFLLLDGDDARVLASIFTTLSIISTRSRLTD